MPNSIYTREERVVMVSILCLCIAITLIGNMIMIWAITKIASLRTINNTFLASLCCANLLNGVYTMPLIAHAMITNKVEGDIASWNCTISGLIDNAAMVGFIWTLTVLSLDRYCLITFPILYKCRQSQRVALITISIVWLFSFMSVIPPLFNIAKYRYSIYTFSCGIDPSGDPESKHLTASSFYFMVFSIFNSALPIPIVLFSHLSILRVLLKTRNIRHEIIVKRYQRSALLMMALTLYLFISMSPVFIGSYMFVFCLLSAIKKCTIYVPYKLIMVAHILFLGNGAVTPIFFGLFNSSIRTKYMMLLNNRKQSLMSNIAGKYPAGLAGSLKRKFSLQRQDHPQLLREVSSDSNKIVVEEPSDTCNGLNITYEDNKLTYDGQSVGLTNSIESSTDTLTVGTDMMRKQSDKTYYEGEEMCLCDISELEIKRKVCNNNCKDETDKLLLEGAMETAV